MGVSSLEEQAMNVVENRLTKRERETGREGVKRKAGI